MRTRRNPRHPLPRGGGVYVYRCRKPGAVLGWPIIGRHFAYVGETTSFFHRHGQHMDQQPWADLEPRCVARIPLPRYKPLMRFVETVLILLLWPVYNHSKNLWNPRRIDRRGAKLMRQMRDRRIGGLFIRVTLFLRNLFSLGAVAAAWWAVGKLRGWW